MKNKEVTCTSCGNKRTPENYLTAKVERCQCYIDAYKDALEFNIEECKQIEALQAEVTCLRGSIQFIKDLAVSEFSDRIKKACDVAISEADNLTTNSKEK